MTKQEIALDKWWKDEMKNNFAPSQTITAAFMAGWKASTAREEEAKVVPYAEILEITNSILGKKFKVSTPFKGHLNARWAEGMRVADFERVCRIKQHQWANDPKMAPYLRPETLFGSKMDAYNNEPEPPKKKFITNHLGVQVEVDDD